MSKTSYDDAFKTLINGPELIVISFINEIFHTNHPYDSRIYTLANESLSPESQDRRKKQSSFKNNKSRCSDKQSLTPARSIETQLHLT